jgi:hypothetical protein
VVAGARARGKSRVTARVRILGAGSGGLELGARLSESLGDALDVTILALPCDATTGAARERCFPVTPEHFPNGTT